MDRPWRGSGTTANAKRYQSSRNTMTRDDDKLRELKRLLRQAFSTSRPNSDVSSRFFRVGLELVNGDVAAAQETVKLLAQEEGLSFVRDLVELHIPRSRQLRSEAKLWGLLIKPLFQLISHERVVASAVLEQQVVVIYNFMVGIGGRRMKVLFDFVLKLIEGWTDSDLLLNDMPAMSAVELTLAVLTMMVDCNTTNIVNDHFNQIVERLDTFIRDKANGADDYYELQSRNFLKYLQRRLGVGESLPVAQESKGEPVTRAEFVLRKDLPGHLSTEGPRHDNDHADICDIAILPTPEEIGSPRPEYLPNNDPSQFHRSGILGRLDREFRLLREGTVGQLRDATREALEALRNPEHNSNYNSKSTLRTYMYHDAEVLKTSFKGHDGLDMVVRFRQPTRDRTRHYREEWWTHSKRLQPDGLVCVIGEDNSIVFCTVGDKTIITDPKYRDPSHQDASPALPPPELKPSLADQSDLAFVYLHLAEATDANIRNLLQWYRSVGQPRVRSLVEFPGVLLPSFQHTLLALQRMSKQPDVPFADLIAPSEQHTVDIQVPPPRYVTRSGFSINLSCLTTDGKPLYSSLQSPLSAKVLANRSTLDSTQASALLDALSRSLALIQGPPGTGKSFTGEKLIKVLLASKHQAELGPILVVCYTNHALDQALEHLLDDRVDQIIRIGSRSKSKRLEDVNLRIVTQDCERTRAERQAGYDHRQTIKDQVSTIERLLQELACSQTHSSLLDYLSQFHPSYYDTLCGKQIDDDGFETVRRQKGAEAIDQWLRNGKITDKASRSILELEGRSLWGMTQAERHQLHSHWLTSLRDILTDNITAASSTYNTAKADLDKVYREVDLRCLQQANVVGITTTGLARNLDLLRKLRCKVLLCEEAAEVLEAHVLTALLPSVEHAILIGDHLQLRPQIQNYELQSTNPRGAQYSLDVSLFERLVLPPHDTDVKLPFSTLRTQRRMHPSIAQLIRNTLYPSLEDGGNVNEYPEVTGMKRRLFWFHHEVPEDLATQVDPTATSHTNQFEVVMTIALVQHLVRQGSYGPNDIAVLTPYLSQLLQLRREMASMFEISVGEEDAQDLDSIEETDFSDSTEDMSQVRPSARKRRLLESIRLATIDNFQGEEAKVVVISLVRSNEQNRCGFLSTSNRVNVLLSRAKHGMYIIGNSKTYGHVEMWSQVLKTLEKHGNIGNQLELSCPRHADRAILACHPDHFLQFAPEGGCTLPCDRRLPCGHPCINRCHADVLHHAVKCLEPCVRPLRCDHRCPKACGEPCELKCKERIDDLHIVLDCGHVAESALCWETERPELIKCTEKVARIVPACGHTVTVPCHTNVISDVYRCMAICGDPQPCGHMCRSPCHRCKIRVDGKIMEENHGVCQQECGRKYSNCGHSCSERCHVQAQCLPCSAPCETRCSHSKCDKKCHEPCAPCAEEHCASSCPHARCSMPCAAPCDWVPCSKRCQETLSCGHQCPSLCGEACPDPQYCQACGSEEIKSTVVDVITNLQYQDADLDDDPCIFPDCGHFVTKSNMDSIMDMKSHYEVSSEGNPTAVSHTAPPFSINEIKTCPTCRGPLRNIARYGRIVRRAMLDEATKKFITWSDEEHRKLAGRLNGVRHILSTSQRARPPPTVDYQPDRPISCGGRLGELVKVQNWIAYDRYKQASALWHDIVAFVGLVRKQEQPLQHVADLVQHALRQQDGQSSFSVNGERIQYKAYLQAVTLWLECDFVILSDLMKLHNELARKTPNITLDFSYHLIDCARLIALAQNTRHPRQELEGHVYYAKFCALGRALALAHCIDSDNDSAEAINAAEEFKEYGKNHLDLARAIAADYPSLTTALIPDIEAAELMLNNCTFYSDVSAEEKRAVYEAMVGEFSGTGHWYICRDNHPFMVGECGLPMQLAKCPECGAPVRGMDHEPAGGMQTASEYEKLARRVDQMEM